MFPELRLDAYEQMVQVGDILSAHQVAVPQWFAKAVRDPQEPGRYRKMAAQDALYKGVRRYFNVQKSSIRRELERVLTAKKATPNVETILAQISPVMRDESATAKLLQIMLLIAQDGVELFAIEQAIGLNYSGVHATVAAWARQYTSEWLDELDASTQRALRQAVTAFAETPGYTIGDVMAQLRPQFDDSRLQRIAVTEITNVYAEANLQTGYALRDETGVRVIKTWFTNNDSLVCEICGPLNGKSVLVDAAFVGGDGRLYARPATHPECRCWMRTRTDILEKVRLQNE